MTGHYAGIGSRETPPETLNLMTTVAGWLRRQGWILRSGGAAGADTAFERGAAGEHQIFLPWLGFGNGAGIFIEDKDLLREACHIAKTHHPAWHRCSDAAKRLHTRNTFQILGPDLRSPSAFVVCWTKDGEASGGTGQALRIAAGLRIPIFNLHDQASPLALRTFALREGVFA